jgi:AcrR family transcriptional regulator
MFSTLGIFRSHSHPVCQRLQGRAIHTANIRRITLTRGEQVERTRPEVLDNARRLFCEQGFDATTLQMIADTMGVTKADVCDYFRTKIEIREALLTGTVTELNAMLDAAEAIKGHEARIDFSDPATTRTQLHPRSGSASGVRRRTPLSQGPPLRMRVSWQRCRYRIGGVGATVVSGTSGPFWSPS